MPDVTRDTPWRHIGAVPYAMWKKRINDAGGVPEYAAYEVWQELGEDSALALEMLGAESAYASLFAKIPASWWNAWNLQIAGVGVKHEDAVEAAEAWRSRLYDPRYKQGVYGRTNTIADLIGTYAPKSDGNDTEGYIAGLVAGLNRNGFDVPVDIPSTGEEPVVKPEQIKPKFVDAPVIKQANGQGFNYGDRGPIVGLVIHETQGRGTGEWYRQFFSCPDGERCSNALVDWLIDRDGTLWEYQDPYTSNRIPWASGRGDNYSTVIGRAINTRYPNVNDIFAAVEMVKTDTELLTQSQIQTAGKLLAFVMAKAGYPANAWRYPAALGGAIYTAPHHSDISQTSCRIGDSDKTAIEAVCDRELAAYYGGVTPAPTPAPVEEVIPGLDYAIAARLFGSPKGEDGKSYSFDKNGPVSKLWMEHGKATGEWPALTEVYSYEGGDRRYFLFGSGLIVIVVKGQEPRWLKAAA